MNIDFLRIIKTKYKLHKLQCVASDLTLTILKVHRNSDSEKHQYEAHQEYTTFSRTQLGMRNRAVAEMKRRKSEIRVPFSDNRIIKMLFGSHLVQLTLS